MKATKSKELRNLQSGELETKIADAREELMKLRFQQVTGQLTDTDRLRIIKRDVARMLTILREQKASEVTEGEA
ncbi:MAG: 50S ribosomal protein L29 [Anaerolineaceae bacterium]|nr:MAG: 50S ribosomal protein L29 [Anaerolineaceae bacterium]